MTTARDLGAALKYFRTAADVTQVDAAEAMGIGQPYLSSLEGGKFGSSLTHALRLLRFVGCEVIVRPREPHTRLGQRVGGQADIQKVTAASLVDEAATWGMRRRTASAVVTETLDQVLTSIPATPGDDRVLAVIREQAERIGRG